MALVAVEVQELSTSFTENMYALLDSNNIVTGWSWENELDKWNYVSKVKMTLENSPAVINGKWDGTRFIHPLELEKEEI